MKSGTEKRRKSWLKPRLITGVAFDEVGVFLVVIRRKGEAFEAQDALRIELPTDWPANAEEAGKRVASELGQRGVRTRRAVAVLDPRWLFVHSVPLPPIDPEDVPSYAELQAERSFPMPTSDLRLSYRAVELRNGIANRLVLIAIPQKRFQAVEQFLRGMGVEPMSVTVEWGLENGTLAKMDRPRFEVRQIGRRIDLAVVARGVPLYFTCFPVRREDPDTLAADLIREMRLSMARLSPELRNAVREIELISGPFLWNGAIERCSSFFNELGLQVIVKRDELSQAQTDEQSRYASLLVRAVQRIWQDEVVPFEFLPPRLSRWEVLVQRYSQGKARVLLEAGGAVIGLALVAAFAHGRYVVHLEGKWASIRPQVEQLVRIQDNIRQFRPWFDDTPHSLEALRILTEVFPEYGTVWAKMIRYKADGTVEVTGMARDPQSLQQVSEALRAHQSVQDVKVQQVRGQNPIEFRIQVVLKATHNAG